MSTLRLILAMLVLLVPGALWAAPVDSCVQIVVTVQPTAPRITLGWPADAAATGYSVHRRDPTSTSWGSALATLPANATGWSDSTAASGAIYEYKVAKTRSSGVSQGVGYAYSGVDAPLVDARGKLVLVVDDTQAAGLASQLTRLQSDLVADGWQVIRHDVSRTATVTSVKALIKADYTADPANVKMVFLVGHVPVPYSGLVAPDGHIPDHQGAWPADAYYGDMNGSWTDSSINNSGASDPRNRNVPGDGKFDQSYIPGTIMLAVGRVDMANMPAFGLSETALLARYLDKAHAWRTGAAPAVTKALLKDNLGDYAAGAQAGYRNFPPLVGIGNITICDGSVNSWRDPLRGATAAGAHTLWAYACAGSGYQSCGDIIYTSDYAAEPYYAVFVMLFGSYHGDWDSGNNVMRAVLANAGAGLSASWGGRPNYFYHRMGLGEPLGSAPQITMGRNAEFDSTAYNNHYPDGVHLGLMGDPSVRMHPLIPPASATASAGSGSATISWGTSPHAGLGYHVYRAASAAGPFARVSASPVTGTSYVDTAGVGTFTYQVKAVRLETTPSGSYVNASQGTFTPAVTITNGTTAAPVVSSGASATGTVGVAFSYQITASNSPTSYGASGLPPGLSVNTSGLVSGTPTTAGTWNATVSATNAGGTGSKGVTITINAAVPAAPVVSSAASATGTVGVAFTYQIAASNTPTSYGASGLPPGLSVNTANGLVSGTPTTAGTWNATVSATNAGGSGSRGVAITIYASGGGSGTILREYWSGIAGMAVADLTGNAAYPGSPSGSDQPTSFEAPTDWADNYGTRMRGYVTAPVSGQYIFWIAADDNAELWLSTSTDPVGKSRIAFVPGWTGSRVWNAYAEQQSIAITLTAGQKYYIEALHKEGGGGDNLAVAWQLPGGGLEAPIPGSRLSPWVIVTSAPVVSSAASATGTVGAAFGYQITASNTPTSYGASGLPPGLSVTTSGLVSGTPTTAGTWNATVSATNAGGTGSRTVAISISAAATAPTITTQPANRTVTAGQTATFSVVASGTATLQYQWQRNNVNIVGATSASYTTPVTTTAVSGTTYRVVVTNGVGSATSASAMLTVTPSGDTTPPVISAVVVSKITARSATITWTTNEPADSQVQYGTTTAYGSSSPLDPLLVTSHSVTLDNLSRKTTYYFRILSRDAAGNLATYATGTMDVVRADATTRITATGDLAFTTEDEAVGGEKGCGLGMGFGILLAMLALGGRRRASGRR